jgi:glycosyltransferase involved in cell wall biosynthesis
MFPKISIIVPNFNHYNFLRKRISTILSQTYTNYELILLDDASTDNSHLILREVNDIRVSVISINKYNSKSPFIQWKKGVQYASGDYIWIAESDDFSEITFLEKIVTLAVHNPHAGIIFSDSYWIDNFDVKKEDLSILKNSIEINGRNIILEKMLFFNIIPNASAALMRKDLVFKHIDCITAFKTCGDWILYINILMESDLIYLNEKLNYFRWYHESVSSSAVKKNLWLIEGARILSSSNAYKLKIKFNNYKDLIIYWNKKIIKK